MDRLPEYYFDRRQGYNVDKVFKRMKADGLDITKKQVADFAKNTEGRQQFHGKTTDIPISINAAFQGDIIQCDVTYMPVTSFPTKFKYMFSLIDVYSRYAWLVPMRTKDSPEILRAFQQVEAQAAEMFDEPKPFRVVETDDGSEFKSVFGQYMNQRGYEHRKSQPGDKRFMSVIERFHRTAKAKQAEILHNEDLPMSRWPEIIDDFLENYNTAKHSSIHADPKDVAEAKAVPDNTLLVGRADLQLQPGDSVRIEVASADPAAVFGTKSYKIKWSTEVYKVRERVYNKFAIENMAGELLTRRYARYQLFKVSGPAIEAPAKISKRIELEKKRAARAAEVPEPKAPASRKEYNLRNKKIPDL